MADDESLALVFLTFMVGIAGVLISIQYRFAGFIVTGIGIFGGLALTLQQVANAFSVSRIDVMDRGPVIVNGTLTLLSFLPLLLPTYVVVIGVGSILYGVSMLVFNLRNGTVTGTTIQQALLWVVVGLFWIFLATAPKFVLIGILFMVVLFAYSLLPKQTKRSINNSLPFV